MLGHWLKYTKMFIQKYIFIKVNEIQFVKYKSQYHIHFPTLALQ